MDVQLYVYDLTRGMARSMSRQFLGIQIDAVYHTALVFNKTEWFFGAGVQTCQPGATHHGRPMEIVPMGVTQLPMDTIMDYLQSLKEVYTAESYDLFTHNCNNFTNDLSQFLVGKGIPDHITNLPKRVLDTPFGQMLRPQIDASMRSITQADVPLQNRPPTAQASATEANGRGSTGEPSKTKSARYGNVVNVTSLGSLEKHMSSASDTCATIFFTSSTCAPCKVAYPMFDTLAGEFGQALFLKVDLNVAQDVASKYQVRATPTFMTFAKGVKQDEWSGADPNLLRANVERVMNQIFPPHPHHHLQVPTLQFGSLTPVLYTRTPPMDKLMAKLGSPIATQPSVVALRSFVEMRAKDPKEAPLPDLHSIGGTFRDQVLALPVDLRFAAVDLLRCAMVDPRVGGFFAEDMSPEPLIPAMIAHINGLTECPHNLRLVTIHLASNIFCSPLYVKELMKPGNALMPSLVQIITSSVLDVSHPTTRVAAASLAFNIATANYRIRREEEREAVSEGEQVELAASVIERLSTEDVAEAAKALLLTLGYLVYCAPPEGELMDLCHALDARTVLQKYKFHESIAREVANLLG